MRIPTEADIVRLADIVVRSREGCRQHPLIQSSTLALVDCEQNPPLRAVFRDGIVYGTSNDIRAFLQSALRKLGPFVRYEAFEATDPWDPHFIVYQYTGGPRLARFGARARLRGMLKEHRPLVRMARFLTLQDFLAKTTPQQEAAVRSVGFRNLEEFWRAATTSTLPPQLDLEQQRL